MTPLFCYVTVMLTQFGTFKAMLCPQSKAIDPDSFRYVNSNWLCYRSVNRAD